MLEQLQESVLDNIDNNDERLTPVINVQDEDYPEYMFILENTAVGDSPLKDGVSPELLEHTLGAFDVRHMIWYLDRFEYERIEEIDHSLDWKFNQKDYMTCIMFDYPLTVREQVKFIIQMMSVYWMSYWGYSDVLMYKFNGNIYLPMEDRTSKLVAAANDIAALAYWLTHSDVEHSFQYSGKKLKELKQKITNMLPDNSYDVYLQVSKVINQMLYVRARRLKKCRFDSDFDRWRPIITESVLDDIGEISTDSAEQLAAEQTSGNPLDYLFLYVIAIKTDEMDVQNIRIICEMFRLECMLKIYGRQELHEQEYIDWTKWSHLPGNDNFLCLFIDKLPDTMTQRIQFMLKLFTIVLQELNESTSAFRFDKIDDIFKMKSQGHMTKSWYIGYFGQWSEDRKSYDDTLFTSQFATLVNTTNHTIYNECDAELRKIRDRILAKKSAKRLDESVLDDIDGSDMKLSDINSDIRPDDKSLLNYKYMFGFCATGQHNVEPITERICEIMGVDVRVVQWTLPEFRQKRDIIDQSHNIDYETEFLVCVFFNRPESIYKRVKFMIRMMSSLLHDYDMLMDVCKYINYNGDKFIYDKYKVNTVRYAFQLDGYLLRLKYGLPLDKDGVEETKTRFRGQFIQLMFDDVALDDYQYNEPVDEILDKMIQRATHGNSSLLESVLDDIDGSDIEQKNVLVQKSTSSPLDYSDMFLFNTVRKDNERDNEIALSRIQDLGRAMGIDVHVEDYDEDELSELDYEYLDYSFEQYFQTDYLVCVYVNPPKSDYQMAKFFFALMRLISKEFEVSTDIYLYHNPSGKFFDAEKLKGRTMLKLDLVIGQEKLNAKNNQTMNIMSYGPTIYVYQDVCDILGFETPDRKLAVERALKNLLKQVRLSVTSGLNESVLDDLQHSDMNRDELVQTTMPDELYYEYMFMFEIKDDSYDPEKIYDMAAAMGVEVRVNEYDYIEDDYANIDYIDHFQDDAHRSNHFLAVFVNLPASDYRKALFIIQLLRTVSWIYGYNSEPTVWTYKKIGGKFKYLCWTANTMNYIKNIFIQDTVPNSDTVINLRTDVAYIIKYINSVNLSPRDEVQKALMHILSASVFRTDNYKKSAKLQESILDDVEQTSSNSASSLKDLPTSVDTNIERFKRFPRAFMFHYANRKRYNLEIVLNTLGVDYELLDVSKDELDNIDWLINNGRNLSRCLILFVELPKTIFERTKLFMKILSAVLSDYALLIDLIDIYHRETESDETKFVNRGSASAVIGTSSDLNNYFNGGSVYNNKSARTIDTFISIWKKQFTNLLDYGMNWTSAFNKLDMTIGRLDRRRLKLLNVKRNHLEKTTV